MVKSISIKRALISVSDKEGIVDFATFVRAFGAEIISTGGTARLLKEKHIDVQEIASYTNFPEIMDGRVKTLHPKVFAGILGRREQDQDIMDEMSIFPIDCIVVNLYPFQKVIENKNHTLAQAIENIDIGGPSLIRAAAKNFQDVVVIVHPQDYALIVKELKEFGAISYETRRHLAQKAFSMIALYDFHIAKYFNSKFDKKKPNSLPEHLDFAFEKKCDLRYGENPHQKAALYEKENSKEKTTLVNAKQLQGKTLSFNNFLDADTARSCVSTFSKPACVIVKHANPCGVAVDNTPLNAYEKAFKTDPTSAFGGIIAFNQSIDLDVIEVILSRQFVEVIIAPKISSAALDALSKKPNVRFLQCANMNIINNSYDLKSVDGGLLAQEKDLIELNENEIQVVTETKPTKNELNDLIFAWKVVKFVKSNAIVYAKNQQTLGIGAGQMNRVESTRIAAYKAKEEGFDLQGTVIASDAFFPFRDSIDTAAEKGVKAIIQPGGSIRDSEVISAANEHGITMVFTNIRHFRH